MKINTTTHFTWDLPSPKKLCTVQGIFSEFIEIFIQYTLLLLLLLFSIWANYNSILPVGGPRPIMSEIHMHSFNRPESRPLTNWSNKLTWLYWSMNPIRVDFIARCYHIKCACIYIYVVVSRGGIRIFFFFFFWVGDLNPCKYSILICVCTHILWHI